MATSPTQRTLQYLRDLNIRAGIVEKWISIANYPGGGKRIDLWGVVDIVGLDDIPGTIFVQSCGSDFSGHVRKITDEEHIEVVKHILKNHNRFWLIGWRKVKLKRGGKAMRWKPRVAVFTLGIDGVSYSEIK